MSAGSNRDGRTTHVFEMDRRSKRKSPALDVFGLFIFSVYQRSGSYRPISFGVCEAMRPHPCRFRRAEWRREPGLQTVH